MLRDYNCPTGQGSKQKSGADLIARTPPAIDEWRIVVLDGGDRHLVGIVCDHPLLRHGARAVTSKIEWIDEQAGLARTQSRLAFWDAVQKVHCRSMRHNGWIIC